MESRRLGVTGIEVSEIALGSWMNLYGRVAESDARACVRAAFDSGVTLFDTANSYGFGLAEELLGRALKDVRRDSYVVATKVFMPMSEDHPGGLSAREIQVQLDSSLTRLGTDYIDLYQCHRFDPNTPVEETMEAMTAALDSGKVRAIGFSEWLPDQIAAGIAALAPARFASSQVQYNLLWRTCEPTTFPLCADHHISQLAWSPLAQGVLTGKYLADRPPPVGSRAADPHMAVSLAGDELGFLRPNVLSAVQGLVPIAAELGLTLSQLALAWVLRRQEVATAIIGASRPEQIYENVSASGVVLDEEVLAAIDQTLGDTPQLEPKLIYRQRPGVMHRA